MFYEWGDTLNGLGAYAPSVPGDPGRGVDLGGRLIGKGGIILPQPPANCPADYRAKYIRTFGVDPGCTPLPMVETPYVAPGLPAAPGTNAGPGVTPPYVPPIAVSPVPPTVSPTTPTTPATPVSPPVAVTPQPYPRHPRAPRTQPVRRSRPGKTSEICPSYGHVNRQIPGVDEYQVVACTPGQPVQIDRGLRRVVRQEALARHPGGGRERQGQAGDYQGRRTGSGSTGTAAGAAAGATGGSFGGSICISPMVLIAGAVAAFFLFKR